MRNRTFARVTGLPDNGPDAFPSSYAMLVNEPSITWDTTDISDHGSYTYPNAGEYSFPVPEGSYDIVLSGQVIEHVRKIWIWVRELERVCKKGGYVIIINPVSWTFHQVPLDCWRIYPDGMKALLEDTALRIVDSRFESLETPGYKRYRPGISSADQTPKMRLFYKLGGMVGSPGRTIVRHHHNRAKGVKTDSMVDPYER